MIPQIWACQFDSILFLEISAATQRLALKEWGAEHATQEPKSKTLYPLFHFLFTTTTLGWAKLYTFRLTYTKTAFSSHTQRWRRNHMKPTAVRMLVSK